MKIAFIQNLQSLGANKNLNFKNLRVVGKRTTLYYQPRRRAEIGRKERLKPIEMFANFIRTNLPSFEQKIQLNILNRQFEAIKNETLKRELVNSYIRRRVHVEALMLERLKAAVPAEDPVEGEIGQDYKNVITSVPLKQQTEDDIGLYNEFKLAEIDKYFQNGMFGDFLEDDVIQTRQFDIMTTEQGLNLTNNLKYIDQSLQFSLPSFIKDLKQQQSENDILSPVNYQEFDTVLLNDDVTYKQLFISLSKPFVTSLLPLRTDPNFERLLSLPGFFQSVIHTLLRQFHKPEYLAVFEDQAKTTLLFDQIAAQFKLKADPQQSNPQDPLAVFQAVKILQFENLGIDGPLQLPQTKQDFSQISTPPEIITKYSINPDNHGFNSGIMLYGTQGSGQSGVLTHVTMWAHRSNWVVASIPSLYNITQKPTEFERHHQTGLYVQPTVASEWLDGFITANKDLLAKIPVKLELYGKYNYSGSSEAEAEPVPNIYDSKRQTFFKEYERHMTNEQKKLIQESEQAKETKLVNQLKTPKYLLEIANFAVQQPYYATNAIAEIMEQLYNMDSHCLLVVVDDYNYMFKPTVLDSFRYSSNTKLAGKIPPHHLAFTRLFTQLDGHMIQNGFKIVASSNKHLFKHHFGPEKIFLPKNYAHQMKGLPLDDFRNMYEYGFISQSWHGDLNSEKSAQFVWMQTQGNWWQAKTYMRGHLLDII